MIDKLTFRLALALLAILSIFYISNTNAYAACSITTPSAISFGAYDVFSLSDNTGTGSFAVTGCSGGARTYVTTLSTGVSNTYTTRTMTSSGNKINYNLYTDNTYTSVWGSGSGGTSSVSKTNTGGGTGSTITIYAKMPSGQDASIGTYTDSINITITF
jgi:spore coat protein U-like protein